jgi:hypothetical protein
MWRSSGALLEQVAAIERKKRPFPTAQDFVCRILAGRSMSGKKPLRKTELAWNKPELAWNRKKINVRSTLWAGSRGGAAGAACLTLLRQSQCPIWPWHPPVNLDCLVEAFPAAQLCHWGMEFEGYNGDSPEAQRRDCRFKSTSIECPTRKYKTFVIAANLTPRKCLSFQTLFQAVPKERSKDVLINPLLHARI